MIMVALRAPLVASKPQGGRLQDVPMWENRGALGVGLGYPRGY